jgi:hypothetical protein
LMRELVDAAVAQKHRLSPQVGASWYLCAVMLGFPHCLHVQPSCTHLDVPL